MNGILGGHGMRNTELYHRFCRLSSNHLATIFYLRRELGVPLPWLSVYPARWPKPMLEASPRP